MPITGTEPPQLFPLMLPDRTPPSGARARFSSNVEAHIPLKLAWSATRSYHAGPGNRLVNVPVKVPASSFSALPLVTLTDPWRFPVDVAPLSDHPGPGPTAGH